MTSWSLLLAMVLMVWVFGWGGDTTLVYESYEEAKRRVAELKTAREAAKRGAVPDDSPSAPW